jgi:peptidyl-tRNA hydrolase, PTH1 family
MADDRIKLIVGLGNPGPDYDQTRHNAGFWFVDLLADRYGGHFRPENKFSGEVCRIRVGADDVWLLKPMTFMNRSGQSVRQLSAFYRIPVEEILVVHDELDLEPGMLRLKRGGGHGGHNGLRDITSHLGKEFMRLRIGIGHPGHRDRVVDFVLSRASREDQQAIEDAIQEAAQAIEEIVSGQFQKAMNQLHSR